jgi:hypothetical protein
MAPIHPSSHDGFVPRMDQDLGRGRSLREALACAI